MKIKFYLAILLASLPLTSKPTTLSDYIPQSIKDHPYTTALVATGMLGTSYFTYQYFWNYEDRWNWKKIDTTNVSFPKNFIWGTGDSAFQTEGVMTVGGKSIKNSWTDWEEQIIEKNGVKQPRTPEDKRAGIACDRWTHYKEDIQLAADIGLNAHRFSIEWSKIEPEEGKFDEAAIQHYIDYAQAMLSQGISPIPTLWHHTFPLWLKNGFEDEGDILKFKRYALYVLNAFKQAGLLDQVKIWLTLNEPVGFVLAAYVDGKYPPGKKYSFELSGKVTKNMLDAHIAVYDAFKEIDPSLKISFAHMMNPIQPYHPWNPLDSIPAKIFDYLTNDVALEYFKTGNFYWLNIADVKDITLAHYWNKIKSLDFDFGIFSKTYNPKAIGKLDFIGVNYYTHTLLKMFKPSARPGELLADNYEVPAIKAMYPEGFYHVLNKAWSYASSLSIPILITENGFAATDKLREDYLKKHLYIVHKAMHDGIDIRGYLFWTLTDCFGWNSGQHSRHGIYAVDFETQERTFRPGAQYLVDVIKESKKTL